MLARRRTGQTAPICGGVHPEPSAQVKAWGTVDLLRRGGVRGAGGLSPTHATAQQRAQEAGYAQGWYKSIVADSFG